MGKYRGLQAKDFTSGRKNGSVIVEKSGGSGVNFKMTTKISPRDARGRFEKINKAALEIAKNELSTSLNQAMTSSVWGSGENIVDTGYLMNSLSISVEGSRLIVKYDADYANLIHYGGYIRPYGNENAGLVYIPGRPWVESVIVGGGPVPQFDFESVYRRALNSVF